MKGVGIISLLGIYGRTISFLRWFYIATSIFSLLIPCALAMWPVSQGYEEIPRKVHHGIMGKDGSITCQTIPYTDSDIQSFQKWLPQPDAYVATQYSPAFLTPGKAAKWAQYFQQVSNANSRTLVSTHLVSDNDTNKCFTIEGPDGKTISFTYSQLEIAMEKL